MSERTFTRAEMLTVMEHAVMNTKIIKTKWVTMAGDEIREQIMNEIIDQLPEPEIK